jgi:hypothetical protein
VLDHLGDAADRRGDHGQAEGEGLHDRDSETLPVGRQHEHVAGRHGPDGVGTVPQQQEPVTQPHAGVEGTDLRFQRSLAHRHEPGLRYPLEHGRRRRQQVGVRLLRPQVGHRADHGGVGVESQLDPHRGPLGALRPHALHLDALQDHVRALLDRRRQRGSDGLGDREPGVVQPAGQAVGPAARRLVAVPDVVVGHDQARPQTAR